MVRFNIVDFTDNRVKSITTDQLQTTYYPDGSVETISHLKDEQPHREAELGPAVIDYHPNGSLSEIIYMNYGIIHNILGPAIKSWHPDTGLEIDGLKIPTIRSIEFFIDGSHHHDTKPAYVEFFEFDSEVDFEPKTTYHTVRYDKDGNLVKPGDIRKVVREEYLPRVEKFSQAHIDDWIKVTGIAKRMYYRKGRLHREGGLPAIETYYSYQEIMMRAFYYNGKKHRDPKVGPAVEKFYPPHRITRDDIISIPKDSYKEEDNRRTVQYWVNGEKHRDPKDGPAVIKWHDDILRWGSERKCKVNEYWVDGLLDETGTEIPTVRCWDSSGLLNNIKYYSKDVLHRDGDEPAVVFETRDICIKKYMKRGELDRDPNLGPAYIEISKRSSRRLEKYYQAGELSRPDGLSPVIAVNSSDDEHDNIY